MAPITSGDVRRALQSAVAGSVVGSPEVWAMLRSKGAVDGPPDRPQVNAVGRHVLAELEVRAYRTDDRTLDDIADHLARVASDMEQVAKTAEYFLAELGPVTPPEALPLLRPVAIGLANRRASPEELAQKFRNTWGSVEVMGGDPRDRLLAAELLSAAETPLEELYAPLMTTIGRIREVFGERGPSVAPATILHLHPREDGTPPFDEFQALRESGRSEEEAALLAGLPGGPTAAEARRAQFLPVVEAAGESGGRASHAASYLAAIDADPTYQATRVSALSDGLRSHFPDPGGLAALLASIDWLEPGEIANWAEKAREIVRNRGLAPSPPEIAVLGAAIVHGLPTSEFVSGRPREPDARHRTAGLLTIHRWLYRPVATMTPGPSAVAPAG